LLPIDSGFYPGSLTATFSWELSKRNSENVINDRIITAFDKECHPFLRRREAGCEEKTERVWKVKRRLDLHVK
jgi:hypothetical protein